MEVMEVMEVMEIVTENMMAVMAATMGIVGLTLIRELAMSTRSGVVTTTAVNVGEAARLFMIMIFRYRRRQAEKENTANIAKEFLKTC